MFQVRKGEFKRRKWWSPSSLPLHFTSPTEESFNSKTPGRMEQKGLSRNSRGHRVVGKQRTSFMSWRFLPKGLLSETFWKLIGLKMSK